MLAIKRERRVEISDGSILQSTLKMKTYLTSALLLFMTAALALPSLHAAEPKFSVLANFASAPEGSSPQVLIEGRAGNFYGTTAGGGANNNGTVFKLTPDGKRTVLASFDVLVTGGAPTGLVEGPDGSFYGTTHIAPLPTGDPFRCGAFFKLTRSGGLGLFASFDDIAAKDFPAGEILQGQDGNYYGATSGRGVYKLTPAGKLSYLVLPSQPGVRYLTSDSLTQSRDGTFYRSDDYGVSKISSTGVVTDLVQFPSSPASELSSLIEGADGNLYGTRQLIVPNGNPNSGQGYAASLFKLTPEGTYSEVASLDVVNGVSQGVANPSEPAQGKDGNFYVTAESTQDTQGLSFKISPGGAVTRLGTLKGFTGINEFIAAKDGRFYGVSAVGDGAIVRMGRTGTLAPLTIFQAPSRFDYLSNVIGPNAFVAGSDGNFYGTTEVEGDSQLGSVFKLTPKGQFSILASFNGRNGAIPCGSSTFQRRSHPSGLIQGADGNFYGTTYYGGSTYKDQSYPWGLGTVFRITPAGVLTTLVSFKGPNGAAPRTGLTQGKDGNFYGTTTRGGKNDNGTIFKMTPAGTLTTLFSFPAGPFASYASLVVMDDGTLYGLGEQGRLYKVSPNGTLTIVADYLANMASALLLGPDGNFYTADGIDGHSPIHKITPQGIVTVLAANIAPNGSGPQSALIVGPDGNFYGTTYGEPYAGLGSGSPYGSGPYFGTVFRVTPKGVVTTLVAFNGLQGGSPKTGLVVGTDGNLYGTTSNGILGYGNVFELALKPLQAQTVSFAELTEAEVGQTQGLKASSSSGLPITYRVLSGSAKIVGDEVVFTGAGVVRIAAEQVGNGNYKPASTVHSLAVHKNAQAILPFLRIPTQGYLGTFPIIPPRADSGLAVAVSVKSGPATISGIDITTTGPGKVTLEANQPGDANTYAARTVTTSFVVVGTK